MNSTALIKAVQARLGIAVDGIAGPATWTAICAGLHITRWLNVDAVIRAVQAQLSLSQDGIDGPATWAAISRALITSAPLDALHAADVHSQTVGSGAYWQAICEKLAPQRAAAHVKQIAVRGWLEGTSKANRDDIYDDVIVRMIGSDVMLFKAAVDPSTYLVKHPINTDGAAQLTAGLWLFRRGIHKGVEAHKCFIQAEDFIVNRLDKNGAITHQDKGDFGIHEHSGGAPETTDHFSAGCQIVWNPDGYWGQFWFMKFYTPQEFAMQDADQEILPYLLINAEDLPHV